MSGGPQGMGGWDPFFDWRAREWLGKGAGELRREITEKAGRLAPELAKRPGLVTEATAVNVEAQLGRMGAQQATRQAGGLALRQFMGAAAGGAVRLVAFAGAAAFWITVAYYGFKLGTLALQGFAEKVGPIVRALAEIANDMMRKGMWLGSPYGPSGGADIPLPHLKPFIGKAG